MPRPIDDRPVTVTGAAGFIGSHLVERLLDEGRRVIAIDDLDAWYPEEQKRSNLVVATASSRCEVIIGDLVELDLDDVLSERGPVVHLAARPGVQDSWDDEVEGHRRNVAASHAVFRAAHRVGSQRVLFASSSSVYGSTARAAAEHRAVQPLSPYGADKVAVEHTANAYRHRGLPSTALRFFTVYGPRQRPDMAFHRLIEAALPGTSSFRLRGDGRQLRHFTYVDDVVDAISRCLGVTGDAPLPGDVTTLNIGSDAGQPLRSVIDRIESMVGAPVRLEHVPPAPGDPDSVVPDLTKIRHHLGWAPSTGLDAGLSAQLSWHRARRGLDVVALSSGSTRAGQPHEHCERDHPRP